MIIVVNPVDTGTLTVTKRTLPGGLVQAFTFSPSTNLPGGNFQLSDGQSKSFSGLNAGTYQITETVPTDWTLTTIDCGAVPVSRVGDRLSVTLTQGQSATCVFTNVLTEVLPEVIEPEPVTNPSLTVDKTALIEPDADGAKTVVFEPGNGATVDYLYTITNTGDVTITDITAFDDVLGDLFPATTTLAPGESTTATATHVVTQTDADAFGITNVVTITGTDPDGQTVTATDTESVGVIEVLPEVIERPPAAPEPAPETLPRTGADSAGLFALSLLLLAIGIAALGLDPTGRWSPSRRRSTDPRRG